MCKHKLKWIRQSGILNKGKFMIIDVYQCQVCKKYWIVDTATDGKISLGGKIGEEIE